MGQNFVDPKQYPTCVSSKLCEFFHSADETFWVLSCKTLYENKVLFGMLFHRHKLTSIRFFTDHPKSYKKYHDHRKSYKKYHDHRKQKYHGNHYIYPLREHQIKRFENPSFIQIINRGSVLMI